MTETQRISPQAAVAHAARLHGEGQPEAAELLLRRILEVAPWHPGAMHQLGVALADQKQFYEALYWLGRTLKAERRNPRLLSNYGMVLGELGHHDEAVIELRRAVHLEPDNPVAWNNLGNTLERLGRYQEALEALRHSERLDPHHALNYLNLGVVLKVLDRHPAAIDCFGRAIRLEPGLADAYYNRATSKLLLGDYAGGFPDYEWRLKTVDHAYYCGPFEQPKWTGQDLENKAILIHAEQGMGDEIQFLRYVPLVAARGARPIYLILHTPMHRLASRLPVTILKPGDTVPAGALDYWCPLMSLPAACGTTLDNLPAPYAFDLPTPELPPRGLFQPRVGVCWAGNFKHKNNEHRSILLEQFATVLDVPGLAYVSLQKDVWPIDEAAFAKLDHLQTPQFGDMQDTAQAILQLDLVLTVDTAVAHLAASLGVETWILLPAFKQDWRWLQGRDDSPWYPSVRLFRQPRKGDWASVLARVRAELNKLPAARAA